MHPAETNLLTKLDGDVGELDRRLVAIEMAVFGKADTEWDETWIEEGWGMGVDSSGDVYVIDPVTNRPLSEGYPSITLQDSGHHLGYTFAGDWEDFFVHPAFKVEYCPRLTVEGQQNPA